MSVQLIRRFHKFFALLIGLQLIIWVISGLVFSFINHSAVDGEHLYRSDHTLSIAQQVDYQKLLKKFPNAVEITQMTLLSRTVIKVKSMPPANQLSDLTDHRARVQWQLLDSSSLETLEVNRPIIQQLAKDGYRGGGKLQYIRLEAKRDDENRAFSLPVWKLSYADDEQSHLYFSAMSGEYLGARTASWRVFDFFLMLHFMDYFERDNFNQPLVIIAALLLLFFAISGMLLLQQGLSSKDFLNLYQKWWKRDRIKLHIQYATGSQVTLMVDKEQRLFDLFKDHQIAIESLCGGGGICGRCKVRFPDLQGAAMVEDKHKRISAEQWQDGYRLSCQTYLSEDVRIEL